MRFIQDIFPKRQIDNNASFTPTIKDIIAFNIFSLTYFPDKKADKHELLNYTKLLEIVTLVKKEKDIYLKGLLLLKELAKKHVFASANKRTALFLTVYFFYKNNKNIFIRDTPYNSIILLAIRNCPHYYSNDELLYWFKTGEIREYEKPYGK